MPDNLRGYLHDPGFWRAFSFADDSDRWRDAAELIAEFPVGGNHAVRLELNMDITLFELGLLPPGAQKPLSVGWDDQARWHPHVFRWEELDLVCRAAALTERQLRHPGPALALLWRFAIIGEHDDVDTITPLVDAAFTTLRRDDPARALPFAEGEGVEDEPYWPQIWHQFDAQDMRNSEVVWHRDAYGNWSVTQDLEASRAGKSLHSMRWTPEEPGDDSYFPFTAWRAMLDQARHTLADAVDARWLVDDDVTRLLEQIAAERDLSIADELGRALAAAGCDNPVILTGLTDPVHPAEICWILELITATTQGALIKRFLEPVPTVDPNR